MLIVGYKSTADFNEGTKSVLKHTDFTANQTKKLLKDLKETGLGVALPDDFVLREELEDLGFILR